MPICLAHKLAKQPDRGAQERRAGLSAARTARARSPWSTTDGKPVRVDAVVISTQHSPRSSHGAHCAKDMMEKVIKPVIPAELLDENTKYLRQPHRPLCRGRPAGRHRPDRPQDHRGYLRRLCPPRRRRILRQGPHQGGPQRRLCGPLGGQEHRGCRPGQAAARCSWPMPSAWQSPSPSWWIPSAPAPWRTRRSSRLWRRCLT